MILKAQIAIEFVSLVAIGFFVAIFFSSLIGNQIERISNDNDIRLLSDLGINAKNEIDLAASVSAGYERNFTLPDDLQGVPYNVTIIQTSLIVSTGNKELVFKIPSMTGNIQKGSNFIRNENGAVYLN